MLDLKFHGSPNIHWDDVDDEIKISSPCFITAGYEMRFVYIPRGVEYRTLKQIPVIVTLLRGKMKFPQLSLRGVYSSRGELVLTSLDDSLLFLCYDRGTFDGCMKGDLCGPQVQWIEPAEGCFRTDPKIVIEGYSMNLWYLVPNKNGGIHNHADADRHGHGEMVEFHLQLRGSGWMVKYHSLDEKTEYERIRMEKGSTHPLFCTVDKSGKVQYPWHAYVAGTEGALFIAFEDLQFNDLKKKK